MKFEIGMTFRVVKEEVVTKDATGFPTSRYVSFLWSARSGSRFRTGDEFSIHDITGRALWLTSTSPQVNDKEVAIFREELKEYLKLGMVEEVKLHLVLR